MKLITLNTWEGRVSPNLLEFLKQRSAETDIFCLQEITSTQTDHKTHNDVRTNLLKEITELLSGYGFLYEAVTEGLDETAVPIDYDLKFGQLILYKKDLFTQVSYTSKFVLGEKNEIKVLPDGLCWPVIAQKLKLQLSSNLQEFVVVNIHGAAQPGHKLDTPDRIAQSKNTLDFISDDLPQTILAGDFNLLPDTQSIKLMEEHGFKDLVRDFNIKTTRSSLTKYYGTPKQQNYADYIFTGAEIIVKNFQSLPDEVSDHLPLMLEFELK
jgi:endonuclease/exonuclease/phosphatase family metal-dependent hydrolase